MSASFEKLLGKGFNRTIQSSVFFLLFYLYLWLYIDLKLIYHGGGMIMTFPVFFRGWVFFREFTSYPGGIVESLSAFLSQFFYYSWAGALVVTVQALFSSVVFCGFVCGNSSKNQIRCFCGGFPGDIPDTIPACRRSLFAFCITVFDLRTAL